MSKPIIHRLRKGAPDKGMIWTDGTYLEIGHNNCNLVDFNACLLDFIRTSGEYVLPADEGDIKWANIISSKDPGCNQEFILLPQTVVGGKFKVINYDEFVPKDSQVYKELTKLTELKYPKCRQVSISNFEENCTLDYLNNQRVVIKTTTGSGSRGVYIIDPNRAYLGGSFVDKLSQEQYNNFLDFAKSEKCEILLQEVIPFGNNLMKCNTDFVIRDGKLLGYKWDLVDQHQVQTNWDHFDVVRNEYTDKIMYQISNYLVSLGVVNAIMNFESFSDLNSETWMIEFNWRYSNSMFECQAFHVDLVGKYLRNEPFELPYGKHHCLRYWQCIKVEDIPNYKEGV